jgi:hypothetical protein
MLVAEKVAPEMVVAEMVADLTSPERVPLKVVAVRVTP